MMVEEVAARKAGVSKHFSVPQVPSMGAYRLPPTR
jgi:hypothetical protein